MNLIPKEIKESLDIFKKYFRKLCLTSVKSIDLNYSKIFLDQQTCVCRDKDTLINCTTCPYLSTFDIYLQSSLSQNNINLVLYIKNINIKFKIDFGLFNFILLVGNQKIVILKGLINNYLFYLTDYAIPINIDIPNKLIFYIVLINNNDKEEILNSTHILDKGVINFGISII